MILNLAHTLDYALPQFTLVEVSAAR